VDFAASAGNPAFGRTFEKLSNWTASDDEAVKLLAKAGFDPVYGARPLRRLIRSRVEDAVAEQMLEGNLRAGDTAKLCVKDGELCVESEKTLVTAQAE
jgi:ATP-dependent Clp protease ATP-binding subunit ClpA